jgi:hypothetical protein
MDPGASEDAEDAGPTEATSRAGPDGSERMDGPASRHPSETATGERSPIRATLAIDPPTETGCAIADEANVSIRKQNLTFDPDAEPSTPNRGKCNLNVTGGAGEGCTDEYVQSEVDTPCFCFVFHEVECIPTFERIQENDVIVSVLVPDRETLRHLVEQVRTTGASIRVSDITQPAAERDASVVMDVTDVTEKQLEALRVAIDAGYYDTPRQADLDQLADRLDISKSAVSQRLTAIESNLVRKLGDKWTE